MNGNTGNTALSWGLAVAMLAYIAYRRIWAPPPTAAPGPPAAPAPAGRPAVLALMAPFRAHAAEAGKALAAFDRDAARTFQPGAAEDPATYVRRLFAHRARVQALVNAVRLRLPNDLAAERRYAAAAEELDRAMLERIEDARQRCGAPLVHPGTLGDAWYGAWYRAANDIIG